MAKIEVEISGVPIEAWELNGDSVMTLIRRARAAAAKGDIGSAMTDIEVADQLNKIVGPTVPSGGRGAAKLIARLKADWQK